MEQLRREQCVKIVNMTEFLSDSFISAIFEKAVALGYDIEVIKEIFVEFLFDLNFKVQDLKGADFESIINAEKFIDRLIVKSSHQEQIKSNGSGNLDDEEEDNEEDLVNGFEQEYSEVSADYAMRLQKQNNSLVKKPMTEQQKLQKEIELRNEQMKRITDPSNLRPVILDCKDLALSDSSNKAQQTFLVIRIKKAVEYFEKRNHKIYAILSQSRRDQIMASNTAASLDPKTPDQQIILEMEQKNQLNYAPYKRVGSKRIETDDDIIKLKTAANNGGVIVSNNDFKKYLNHQYEDFKKVIEQRVLMYSFIDDIFMPVEDPAGKNGVTLENFLRIQPSISSTYAKRCPYRKKCTFGIKCKFWHPERMGDKGNKPYKSAIQSVEELAKQNMEVLQKMRLEITKNPPEPTLQQQQNQLTNGLNHLYTKKLVVEHSQLNEKAAPFECKVVEPPSLNLMVNFDQRNVLRAMGPETTDYDTFMSSDMSQASQNSNKKLSNLLAKDTKSMPDSNLNFLDRYGSSNFNNLEDFSKRNSHSPEDNIKNMLMKQLSMEQTNMVMKQYPMEKSIDKLIYLARCLATTDDDF